MAAIKGCTYQAVGARLLLVCFILVKPNLLTCNSQGYSFSNVSYAIVYEEENTKMFHQINFRHFRIHWGFHLHWNFIVKIKMWHWETEQESSVKTNQQASAQKLKPASRNSVVFKLSMNDVSTYPHRHNPLHSLSMCVAHSLSLLILGFFHKDVKSN